MIVSLRDAAIASVVAAVASTSVMAQTTGAIPSQPAPSVVTSPSPPPTTNQFSSNELIGAGSRFFGGVSHGLRHAVPGHGLASLVRLGRFWGSGKEKQPYRVTQSGQDRSREGA